MIDNNKDIVYGNTVLLIKWHSCSWSIQISTLTTEKTVFSLKKILLKKFLLKLPPFSADITEDANSKGSRMPGSTA